jgi:hypothetical protein
MLVCAVACGVIAAGCGGDDADDGTTAATTGPTGTTGAAGGEPLAKEAFINEADAICAKGDHEIDRQAAKAFGTEEPTEQEIEQFGTDTVAPNIQRQIDDIRALTPPEADEEEVAQILDAAQNGIDEIEQDPSLLNQGSDAGGAFAEANRLAGSYGMDDCGG